MDTANVYYNDGTEEIFLKVSQSEKGVDACKRITDSSVRWFFIPWCSIKKIEYMELKYVSEGFKK